MSRWRICRRARDGLIALTGGPARRGRPPAGGRPGAGGRGHAADASRGIFPGRLYVELMRHGLAERGAHRGRSDRSRLSPRPAAGRDQRGILRRRASMYEAHDALLCIAEGTRGRRESDRRRLTPEHRFKSAGRDARAVRRPAGGRRQHAGHRPALRLHAGNAGKPILPAFPTAGRAERGGRAAATRRARGWSSGCRRMSSRPAWTRPSATPRRSPIASGSTTSSASSTRWASPATS